MTTQDYRNMRDKARGTNRRDVYGSSRAYFPLPYATKAGSDEERANVGTPGSLIRKSNETKPTNYENKQMLNKMLTSMSPS